MDSGVRTKAMTDDENMQAKRLKTTHVSLLICDVCVSTNAVKTSNVYGEHMEAFLETFVYSSMRSDK